MALRGLTLIEAAGATPVSLPIRRGMPYEEWKALGRILGSTHRSTPWWLGDWLLAAASVTGTSRSVSELIGEAAKLTGLAAETLSNYKSIASRVPPARRHPKLSFRHHEAVASSPPDEQKQWLQQAAENGWTGNELRRHVRGVSAEPSLADLARSVCETAYPAARGEYTVPPAQLEALAEMLDVRLQARVVEIAAARRRLWPLGRTSSTERN